VTEADFKPNRLLAPRVKRALLVLQGTQLLVLHAAAGGSGEADSSSATAAVLKHIGYSEVRVVLSHTTGTDGEVNPAVVNLR
jgi:hypothetical protein